MMERRLPDTNAQDASDELTPLLVNQNDTRVHKPRGWIVVHSSLLAIVFLVSIAILGVFGVFIVPQCTQSYLADTTQVDVQGIKITTIDSAGFTAQMSARAFVNDSKSHASPFNRQIARAAIHLGGPIQLQRTRVLISLGLQKILVAEAEMSDFTLSLSSNTVNDLHVWSTVNFVNLGPVVDVARLVLAGELDHVFGTVVISTSVTKLFSLRKKFTRSLDYPLPKDLSVPPAINLTALSVEDAKGTTGIAAKASVQIGIKVPIEADVPVIRFQMSLQGCDGSLIPMAIGYNKPFTLKDASDSIELQVIGQCDRIPPAALKRCHDPGSLSPLDYAMQSFLNGNATTVHVSGHPDEKTPAWLAELTKNISVPVEIPGSQSDEFARDIELSDVKLKLPSFFNGGGKPQISGKVQGIIDFPPGVHVQVEVDSVKIEADLWYKHRKFATIVSPGWSPASSAIRNETELLVGVVLTDAPVSITNQDVFSSVVSSLLGGSVLVDVVGLGDVKVKTALGNLEAHKLPFAANDVELGGFGFLQDLNPKVSDIGVLETSRDSLKLVATAELDNPTTYEATVDFVDAHLLYDNHMIGNVSLEHLHIRPGKNLAVAKLRYAPTMFPKGSENFQKGCEMLSRYLSEQPVNATIAAHAESLPDYPELSQALAHLPLSLSLPLPRLIPDERDGEDDAARLSTRTSGSGSQFLVAAKFHLLSSTASFILRNPLNATIVVTDLHAKATYHEDVVGELDYGYPITLSGSELETETTRIPVSWKLPPSDILRKAVRGTLRVNATANATVTMGEMEGMPLQLTLRDIGAGVGL